METILIYFAIKYHGNFADILDALKRQEKISNEEISNLEEQIKTKKINAVTIMDELYPQEFKNLAKPPFVIFYKGNLNLLNQQYKIALSGDKNNERVTKYLNQSLPEVIKRHTLITCYYKNLDVPINDYFLKNNGKIIYISANGLNNPYFAKKVDVNENILVISEYPENVNLSKTKLKNRNRIVAALASSLVIYSSNSDSGIMNLVNNFLNLGKDIFCYPGDFEENDGNAQLIKQGATLITSIKDVHDDKGGR
ncbi:DNA-processing protein DprA [Mesomycoplasma lagogenitalium]|uniref:DNA-processing protein DprA n=1 Tax=Mesomycoplasma lagogenitalium TaxID=171286 RepID=A0ABY8LSQ2_9BACT|nr:DNA-processing protein DprA [Mesomycoplasma lagogenitalium]WGI36291.1 DNA-processing protein DprA [Mesomycoplasma lagogenitalium]